MVTVRDPEWEWMCDRFSPERMRPYLDSVGGDPRRAAELYWWNTEVSSAFYFPLHLVEVSVRNAMHHRMAAMYGRDDWWKSAPLKQGQSRQIEQAGRHRRNKGKSVVTPGCVVSELSLGFWGALVSKRYDRDFWVRGLHRAFPGHRGRRDPLHSALENVRGLRNRVMHHEPVHRLDLVKVHQEVYWLMGCVDPGLEVRARKLDRVPDLLERKP